MKTFELVVSGRTCSFDIFWLGERGQVRSLTGLARRVNEYKLWTRLAVMKTKKATGFEGWVRYELKDNESEWNKVTFMLARFAEYANVGGNKTGGFAVIKSHF